MRILIIGATGPTGRELVSQALLAGHDVVATARRPDSANLPSGVKVIQADVTDEESLAKAVEGMDAVISSIGTKLSRKPTTLLSDGTRNLISAMKRAGVTRLLCVTGIGAGDSKGHGGFLYDRIIQPLLLNEIYKDKTRQEEVVRNSDLKWTLIRPATLTNGPKRENYRVIRDLRGVTATKISRADVAHYILANLSHETEGQTVLLSY